MAECKRACGWRKIGGLYMVGDYMAISCDRIPFPLPVCPVCHSGIKTGRGMTSINPALLFGTHKNCIDKTRPCWLCQPSEDTAFLMRVSEKFYPTPEAFLEEGLNQGFSKRIAQIPRHFILGKTVIYLAHINACVVKDTPELQKSFNDVEPSKRKLKATRDPKLNPRLIEAEKVKRVMGIFTAFVPQRIEKIYWQSDLDKMSEEEKESLKKRGITPVGVVESKHE
jgi:hypothetical protein